MHYDAHLHLAGSTLARHLPEIKSVYEEIGLERAVVVGTSPEDWPDVLHIAAQDARFVPAIGLHPWKINDAAEDWQDQFLSYLEQGVSVIGEIGLDQWIEGCDIERQLKAFTWQMSIAAERNLPTSVHCLKAHDPLLKTLRSIDLPERGFKLHAYNGPVDTMKPLLERGAYFSFNAGQLKPNAKRAPELIKMVPDDRLLIETDAPNFQPPCELREFKLEDPEFCHPGNIRAAYRAITELRGSSMERLAEEVAENFRRFFMTSGITP